MITETMIAQYIFIFGVILTVMGCVEMLMPLRAFGLWKKLTAHRYFFLHGIFLMVTGFPLTIYHGPFETGIFIIGLFIVFSGPFILLFPERFKKTFEMADEEMGGEGGKKGLIYFEAAVRIAAGLVCLISYLIK